MRQNTAFLIFHPAPKKIRDVFTRMASLISNQYFQKYQSYNNHVQKLHLSFASDTSIEQQKNVVKLLSEYCPNILESFKITQASFFIRQAELLQELIELIECAKSEASLTQLSDMPYKRLENMRVRVIALNQAMQTNKKNYLRLLGIFVATPENSAWYQKQIAKIFQAIATNNQEELNRLKQLIQDTLSHEKSFVDGKQMTLYLYETGNRANVYATKIKQMLQDVETKLHKLGIQPGIMPRSDISLDGLQFFSFRQSRMSSNSAYVSGSSPQCEELKELAKSSPLYRALQQPLPTQKFSSPSARPSRT